MNESLEKVLEHETRQIRELCQKLRTLKGPVEPVKVKLFFDLILSISSKVGLLEQTTYGMLSANVEGPFANLTKGKREELRKHLEEMTQAKVEASDKKRNRTTHYDLLANWYEQIGYGRAAQIIALESSNDNPYILEMALMDAQFRVAQKKVSVMLSLLQVIQYIEPMIIDAFAGLSTQLVKPGTPELFYANGELPDYIVEHKHKDYHKKPILFKFYETDNFPGYCGMIAHTFNDVFARVNELLFELDREDSLKPHLSEG